MNNIKDVSLDGVIKDVLIKEVGGSMHDMVFVVNELPVKKLFIKAWKKIPKVDRDGDFTGRLVRSKSEKILALRPGITVSQTGDGGFVFDTMTNAGRDVLLELDRFIADTLPINTTIIRREAYCREPGNVKSPPRQKHELPRVELPVSSPPVVANAAMVQPSPSSNVLVQRSKRK